MAIEYRYMRRATPEVDANGRLTGRAWPYNSVTQIGKGPYGFREKIRAGAGKKSINDGDIVLLDNHETRLPLARMSAGTLAMRDSKHGGEWAADVVDTTYGQDVRKNVAAKNYGGCSFGFEVIKDLWTDDDGNPATPMDGTNREIVEMKVHEISVCTFPAYAATSVSTKEMIRTARGMSPEQERVSSQALGDIMAMSPHGADTEGQPDKDEEVDCDPDGDGDDDCTPAGDTDHDYFDAAGNPIKALPAKSRSSRGGDAKGDGSKPYGNVTYADPGYQSDKKKRYPIDTKDHAKAAWSYVNKAKNAAKYTASQLASIKSKIKTALSKFGVKVSAETNMAQWEALCDFREMTEGYDRSGFDPDGSEDFGVLPGDVARISDVNDLAKMIKDAKWTEDRQHCIQRATDLGLSEILPDHWSGTGEIASVADDDVVRDMDAIYTLALTLPATRTTLQILDLAQAYITSEARDEAARAQEEPEEEPTRSLTLAEAKNMMRDAEDRRRRLSR